MNLPQAMCRSVGGNWRRVSPRVAAGVPACRSEGVFSFFERELVAGRDARHHSSRQTRSLVLSISLLAGSCLAFAPIFVSAATAITPAMAVNLPETLPAGAKILGLEVAPKTVKLHGAYD